MLRILIACEFIGIVRDAFLAQGHDAISCDLLPTESPGPHIIGDVLPLLAKSWDLIIAHPPCTFLSFAGERWFYHPEDKGLEIRRPHPRFPNRWNDRQKGAEFFMACINANAPRICVENPRGAMTKLYRKADQEIQPWQFGEQKQKATQLWLKNLPLLIPTEIVDKGEFYYSSKTGKRMNKEFAYQVSLPPLERMKARSRFFLGVAKAMADQWG